MNELSKVLEALNEQLPRDEIKKVPRSDNDYVSAHYVIKTANRIFGADAWKHEVLVQKLEYQGERNKNVVIVVRCIVRVHAIGTFHDGCGIGLGEMTSMTGAMELAFKASETDAMKRALKNFGDPFGLALYEKVEKGEEREGVGASTKTQELIANLLEVEKVVDAIEDWYDANESRINALPDVDRKALHDAYDAKLDAAWFDAYSSDIRDARNVGEINTVLDKAEQTKLPQDVIRRLNSLAKDCRAEMQSGNGNGAH